MEEERVASVCLFYHRRLRLSTTDTLWHCTTAEFGTARISSHHDGDVASSMMLYSNWPVGVWSESTAGQQRGTGRPICHSRTGRDLRGQWNALLSSSVCQHVRLRVSHMRPHVPESTLGNKMVSNRDKRGRNQRSSERGTKNNTRLRHKVTRLFLSVSFSIVVAFRPPLSPQKSLSFGLSVVMETSQVSVLPAVAPAVHCRIWGSLLKTELSGQTSRGLRVNPTNRQPSAVYRLCERLLGTFACRPA